MAKHEAGNWPAYNVKAIVHNVEQVFKKQDINKLHKSTYEFIINNMHFIAHYNVNGFRDVYSDLGEFAKALQTSEYSDDSNYNLNWASEQETREDRVTDFGEKHLKSISDAIQGIVAVARKYHGQGTEPMLDESDIDATAYTPPLAEPKPKENTTSLKKSRTDSGIGNFLTRMR